MPERGPDIFLGRVVDRAVAREFAAPVAFRISISRGRTDDTASAARQVNLNKRTPPREPERAYLAIRHPAG
jgi:hypothetical protein